jgi:O-antigen/teichoic acid export membrane protein
MSSDVTPGELPSVERRARLGVMLLGLRSVAVQFVVLAGNVQLYRLLSPADFGVFAIVQFAIALFALFGDAGLAAALIQKQAEPTGRELANVWTLQLLLGGSAAVLLGAGAPHVVSLWPSMPASSVMLMRCLALGFLLTLMRVIPTLLMERRLRYGPLAALEVVLAIGFYLPAVVLAHHGLGVLSLGYSIVVQGVLGVIGAFGLQPFRPRLALDRETLAPVLRFGVLFQAKHLFGFGTNAIGPVYAGGTLGQTALGQLGWAQTTGFFPLRLVQLIGRVGFPLYSRLQSERARLVSALESSLHVCAIGTFLFIAVVFGLGAPLVSLLFTERWLAAMTLLYVYTGAIGVGFITPVLMPAIDAMGYPRISTRLSALSMGLVWILVPLGAWWKGTLGFACAYALVVAVGNVVIVVVVRRMLPELAILSRLLPPAVAALAAALCARIFGGDWVVGPFRLVIAIVSVACLYGFCLLAVDRRAHSDVRALLARRRAT